ncbi:MAG: PDZ domain-containing protein [Chloroflexi bacterium]|nr:PDZ domain-containing protein [Chloroflexota bacterium]
MRKVLLAIALALVVAAASTAAVLAGRSNHPALDTPTPDSPPVTQSASQPWIGVSLETLPSALAGRLGLEGAGVLVIGVASGSPAEEAGLMPKDIIAAVNGQQVGVPAQVVDIVASSTAGDTLSLEVRRGDQELALTVTVGQRPSAQVAPFQHPPQGEMQPFPLPFMQAESLGRIIKGEVTVEGAEGQPVTYSLVGGTVVAAKKGELTIQPKDGSAETTLSITDEVRFFKGGGPATMADVGVGAKVVAVSRGGKLFAIVAAPWGPVWQPCPYGGWPCIQPEPRPMPPVGAETGAVDRLRQRLQGMVRGGQAQACSSEAVLVLGASRPSPSDPGRPGVATTTLNCPEGPASSLR